MTITAVSWDQAVDMPVARECAQALRLPLVEWSEAGGLVLLFTQGEVGLVLAGEQVRPVSCGWGDGVLQRRLRQAKSKDILLRACGFDRAAHPEIIDGTGGFGRDAWLLASRGARVVILERHPVVAWLLRRSLLSTQDERIADRITLYETDCLEFFHQLEKDACHVVYLDPMFPSHNKKLKNNKRIELLRILTYSDRPRSEHKIQDLIGAALSCATNRVVLKRPKKFKPIPTEKIAGKCGLYHLTGASNRFDIYTKKSF